MADPRLKSQRFRQDREAGWLELERLVGKAERRGLASLSAEELMALPVLYRGALSSLSVARATSLDAPLIAFLESLSARAYFFVYGARSEPWREVLRFFSAGWPTAVRGLWRETLAMTLLFSLGVGVAFGLTAADPDWFYGFVDPALAAGRDPSASPEALRETLYAAERDGLSVFAAFLFTHNAQVALLAFALGFAFGLPTLFLILSNAAMLGAMVQVFVDRGLGLEFIGWLAIHGVTEMGAVILAGAAGLKIGTAVAFPGERSRLEAAAEAGREAGRVMVGVVIMLFCAGLLEGFGRQLITSDLARYGVAAATLVLWTLYFYGPRPGTPR